MLYDHHEAERRSSVSQWTAAESNRIPSALRLEQSSGGRRFDIHSLPGVCHMPVKTPEITAMQMLWRRTYLQRQMLEGIPVEASRSPCMGSTNVWHDQLADRGMNELFY